MYAHVSCEFVLYRVYTCVLMLKLHEFVLYSVYVCGSHIDNNGVCSCDSVMEVLNISVQNLLQLNSLKITDCNNQSCSCQPSRI